MGGLTKLGQGIILRQRETETRPSGGAACGGPMSNREGQKARIPVIGQE